MQFKKLQPTYSGKVEVYPNAMTLQWRAVELVENIWLMVLDVQNVTLLTQRKDVSFVLIEVIQHAMSMEVGRFVQPVEEKWERECVQYAEKGNKILASFEEKVGVVKIVEIRICFEEFIPWEF